MFPHRSFSLFVLDRIPGESSGHPKGQEGLKSQVNMNSTTVFLDLDELCMLNELRGHVPKLGGATAQGTICWGGGRVLQVSF